jgi:hypothetical protein
LSGAGVSQPKTDNPQPFSDTYFTGDITIVMRFP